MGSVEHRWKRQSPSASSTAITGGGQMSFWEAFIPGVLGCSAAAHQRDPAAAQAQRYTGSPAATKPLRHAPLSTPLPTAPLLRPERFHRRDAAVLGS